MYINVERAMPTVYAYARTLKLYNVIKNYYPRTTVDGIEVFDNVLMYTGGVWLNQLLHRKLYPVLGISREELAKEDTATLEQMYLYWTKPKERLIDVAIADLKTYIDDKNIKDQEYVVTYNYQPPASLGTSMTDEELLSSAITDLNWIVYNTENVNPVLALVLLDTDDDLFTRSFKLRQRSIIEKQVVGSFTSKSISANIELTFTRTKLTSDASVANYFIALKDTIDSLPVDIQWIKVPVKQQLYSIYHQIYTTVDANIMHTKVFTNTTAHGTTTITRYYLKTAALDVLTPKQFVNVYLNGLDTAAEQKDADPWVKVLQIVIMIIGSILAPITDGYSLVIATALVALLVVYFQSIGQAHNAIAMQGTIQSLGIISMVWAFLSVLTNLATKAAEESTKKGIEQGISKSATQVSEKSLLDKGIGKVTEFFSQSTLQIMTQTISFMTDLFQAYVKYIDAPRQKQEIEDKQALLSYQEGQMEEYATPDNLNRMQVVFSSPFNNIYEMNEMMQNVPWLMTEGKIVKSMTKYYS